MRGHIRKRGSKWVLVVDVGYDENGRRKQRWHSGFATKREASNALTEVLSRLQHQEYIEPSKLTVGAFLREWLDAVQVKLRPSTWASYSLNVEHYIVPALGTIPLQNLTAAKLNAFYADLLRNGRTRRDGGLSRRSVRYVHTIIRKALHEAVRWNRLARNVADLADPPSQGTTRAMKVWDADELRRFLEHVQDDRYYAAWLVAATTGVRRGELLGLRWRDVDLDAGRIGITQSLVAFRRGSTGDVVFSAPKTAKGRRSIALDAITLATLKSHRGTQVEERLAWGGAYENNDLVFAREDGSAIHPDAFSWWFRQHVKAAELLPIRLHDLRHSHATLALRAGVHPKVVSERLGHATVSITLDTYSHAIPAMEEEAAEKVAALVFGG